MKQKWRDLFAIHEIEQSPLLQALYWVLLFGFFLSFDEWIANTNMTVEAVERLHHVCLPYFQNCAPFYFLNGWPDSYSQSMFYAGLTAVLSLSALAAYYKNWTAAHALMVPAFLWKMLVITVLTYQTHMDFEYFHLPEVFVFLFLPRKEFFLRLSFCAIYFLSATMKFSESWIVGNYFTSLTSGLPLAPDWSVPWITNAVALFEIATPWLLLSRNRSRRLTVVGLWTLFHLYSIILVQFRYPAHCLPILWLLFLPDPPPQEAPFTRSYAGGWIFVSLLFLFTAVPRLHSEDWLYTLDGKKFAVGMFAANYQCRSDEKIVYKDGHESEFHVTSRAAMHRCEPYRSWFRLRELCARGEIDKINWRYDSSINGGPFYRLVKTENACDLAYHVFGGNPWIRTPSQGAEVVGYPEKNAILKKAPKKGGPLVHKKPQFVLDPTQEWLEANLTSLTLGYWLLWFATLAWVTVNGFRARRR